MTKEEAINKVREMNLPKETKEILEALAPELRESEDERIRARLVEYFQGFLEGFEDCYKDGGCVKWEGLDVKSILAWFEKQKGKMTAEELESSELFQLKLKTRYANGYQDGMVQQQEKQKEPEDVSASTMIPSCWEVEQKEQPIPLMNGDADLYFDNWIQQHSNPTKRECFEAGMLYAVRLLTEDSPMLEEFKKGLEQVILWRREGYKVSPDGTMGPLTQGEIDEVLCKQKEHFRDATKKVEQKHSQRN